MKNTHSFRPQSAITFALLLGASSLTPIFANPEFVYSGHDMTYPQIQINLTITEVKGAYDVTGTIRDGNYLSIMKTGMFAGSTLSGEMAYTPPYSVPAVAPITGTLKGTLGSGSLTVAAGWIYFANAWRMIDGTLYAVAPPQPPSPVTPPPPPPVKLPSAVHMTGGTGFGYTSVTLTLDTRLNGAVYDVTGTIFVKEYINCALVPNCTPHYVDTTLGVSGVLTPGLRGNLSVSGAPAGNSPSYNGTIGADGTNFQSFLSGLPTLGITGLYINATQ
jgi:hypothetical protein